MRIDRFDYDLPPDRIAQEPPARRGESRLLVVDRAAAAWEDRAFADLGERLAPGDLLVVNETRVFPARLRARRQTGGAVELLLTRPAGEGDDRLWDALARPARKAVAGDALLLLERDGAPSEGAVARVVAEGADGARRIRLETPGDPWAWIEAHGHVPLPPYIARPDADSDRERYQTVYARERGAVAAPTAGLHFTEAQLAALAARGIGRAAVVLHVGPGTFRPVAVEDAEDHAMEAEWYRVPEETAAAIARTRAAGGRIVAVGTTTVRALESAAREWGAGPPRAAEGWTDLYVLPGHRFRAVDALITNFHLPRSTLILLVAAFAGESLTLSAYRHAVEAGYRFYSYGDAMLIV